MKTYDRDKAFAGFLSIILSYAAAESPFPPIGIIKLSSNPLYWDGWGLLHWNKRDSRLRSASAVP